MLARVLEVNDQTVYLEIDNQLRFKSKYITQTPEVQIMKSDNINFSFMKVGEDACVVVNDILNSYRPTEQ
ncbi:MAG: hypothetical protein ACOYVF_01375 [Candidatus Zixiibacteriota bacterium]